MLVPLIITVREHPVSIKHIVRAAQPVYKWVYVYYCR